MLAPEVEPYHDAAASILRRSPQGENALSKSLFVVATIVAKPGRADDLRQLLMPAVATFRTEDGCLFYTLYEDLKQPGRFVTHESWRDMAALDAHMASPTMTAAGPQLADLLAEAPLIMPLNEVG